MSKRDVNLYFLQCENDYQEMLSNVSDLKELFAAGQISQEEYQTSIREIELVKSNYERLAYVMFLLNKPNRKSKEDIDMNKSWYDTLKYASKEAIIDENKDALSHIKELLKKGELKNGKIC